jgi:hypothetical protein
MSIILRVFVLMSAALAAGKAAATGALVSFGGTPRKPIKLGRAAVAKAYTAVSVGLAQSQTLEGPGHL